jgi:signal transduction histidine kinase
MRLPGSLRARLTLAALLAVAIGGLIAGPLLLAAVERDGRQAIDRELRQQTAEVLRGGPGPGDGRFGRGPRGGQRLLRGTGSFVQVAYGDEVVAREGDVPERAPAPPRREGFSTVEIGGASWRSLTIELGGPADARFQALASLAQVEDRVASTRRLIVLIGLLALALTGLAAWFFSSLAVRPLARLRAGAERITGAEDLSTPLPDEGPDEVRSLAGTLNGMLARLQASTAATRRFAADAGHELRTPLTSLRANLDALARNPDLPEAERAELLRESSAEQDRIVHLLEGLQALARGEAAEALPREDVELGDLVDAAIYSARRRHPGVVFALREHDGQDGTVHGWANGLRLVADNLLENAALHGAGRVDVDLAREDGGWLLRIADDGPGIPEQERERVLEPFARGHAVTAQGTGLGLAIVAQQVGLHGGELRLTGSELGGLAVEVRLPART